MLAIPSKHVSEWTDTVAAAAKENLGKAQELTSDAVKHASEWGEKAVAAAKQGMEKD
ncbi:MAG: hypothetical protein ACREXM_03010 [Gammaproteobacteria bacterium]